MADRNEGRTLVYSRMLKSGKHGKSVKLENHDFAPIKAQIGSCKNHQWNAKCTALILMRRRYLHDLEVSPQRLLTSCSGGKTKQELQSKETGQNLDRAIKLKLLPPVGIICLWMWYPEKNTNSPTTEIVRPEPDHEETSNTTNLRTFLFIFKGLGMYSEKLSVP